MSRKCVLRQVHLASVLVTLHRQNARKIRFWEWEDVCALCFPRSTARPEALMFAILQKITKNNAQNNVFPGKCANVVFASRKQTRKYAETLRETGFLLLGSALPTPIVLHVGCLLAKVRAN